MNKLVIVGRLIKDAEVRYGGANNTAVAKYTLAVDRRFKKDGDEQTADFIRCISFGKAGEFIEKYGKKGTKFIIEGHLQSGSYEKDGVKHFTLDVITENIEFAESKGKNENPQPQPGGDGFMNIPDGLDEELPFI